MARLITRTEIVIEDPAGREDPFMVVVKNPSIKVMDDLAELLDITKRVSLKKMLSYPGVDDAVKKMQQSGETLTREALANALPISVLAELEEEAAKSMDRVAVAKIVRPLCDEPAGLLDDLGHPLTWDQVLNIDEPYYYSCMGLIANALYANVHSAEAKEQLKNLASSSA